MRANRRVQQDPAMHIRDSSVRFSGPMTKFHSSNITHQEEPVVIDIDANPASHPIDDDDDEEARDFILAMSGNEGWQPPANINIQSTENLKERRQMRVQTAKQGHRRIMSLDLGLQSSGQDEVSSVT